MSMPKPAAHFLNAADWKLFSESIVSSVRSNAAMTLVVVLSASCAKQSQPLMRSTMARKYTTPTPIFLVSMA